MASVDTDQKKIEELLTRSVAEVIDRGVLASELASGRQLRIKLGIDPTSANIHLGRAVLLLKLRDFQQLGHQIVFIVGDFTGVVGDTSDKESERPMLSREQVERNLATYKEQIALLLDIDRTEFEHNSQWLGRLTYHDIAEQADEFSVAEFIARDNIKKRLDAGSRVSLREVLYPLMQGYDSVAVRADVELGGTDQWFNFLAGRRLQEHYGQKPQQLLMTELIPGLDGRKMSSSWGNTINILDEPVDMYGKVMSMHDDAIVQYFISCTRVPMEEVGEIRRSLESKSLNPRDAKARLAREIVALYHNSGAAQRAEAHFSSTFQKKEMPDGVPEISVAAGATLLDALAQSDLVRSKSEARRLIQDGAVTLFSASGEQVLTDPFAALEGTYDLRVGKKRFLRLRTKT